MAPAPVVISDSTSAKSLINNHFRWSGREDSNLRPLPPEDAAHRCLPCNLICLAHGAMVFVAIPFPIFRPKRFNVNLRPLSSAATHSPKLPVSPRTPE